ncbi:MAG: TlpA family protein disulfide reductase [Bacteroidales bacterium]|nr:TlpA family protein disulfide reductase [Bacteroidales bacterium]
MRNAFRFAGLVALAALLLVSCHQQTRDFRAEFDLKGITSEQASITVFGLRDSVRLDLEDPSKPIIPVTDGKFVVSGTTPQAAVLRVSFSQDRQFFKWAGRGYFPNKASSLWFVVEPGTNLTGSADLSGKNFIDFYPDGDKENKVFSAFAREYMPVQNRIGDIAVELETDSTLTDARRKELEAEAERLEAQSDRIRHRLIETHPSSLAGLWLMEDMLIRSQIEPAELEPLLAKVDKKYHDNYFYYTVANRVEGAKLAAVGAPCPDVEGLDVNGNPFKLKDLRGQYIIIDFWGTWCGPCLAGMPAMKEFQEKHADRLVLVGIANDKDLDKVKACMEKHGISWTNLLQWQGETDYVAKFNVQGFPTKVLVDPRGTIVYRGSGESEEFYQEVEKIMVRR